jgi:hypothetical protein
MLIVDALTDEIKLPADFMFSHYLSVLLGKSIAEMVRVPLSVWVSVLAVFLVLWAIAGASVQVSVGLFVILVWSLVGVWAALHWKLRRIYALLVPPIVPSPSRASGSVNSASVVELEEEKLIMPSRLDPPYLHTREVSCCGRKGNRHEGLFFVLENGSFWSSCSLQLCFGLALMVQTSSCESFLGFCS